MSPLPGAGFAGARGDEYLNDYLLRLEHLLAVRLAASLSPGSSFLHGEREIIDGNLQLCLSYPANVTVRVLLLQTLTGAAGVGRGFSGAGGEVAAGVSGGNAGVVGCQ